jgi:NDP-sugar pyrophosphorylase family protein
MYKHAVIISGGKGSRLMSFTHAMPKAMLPVGEYPILEIIVRQLRYFGFNDITFSVFHFAQNIQDYFGNGDKWGVRIHYSVEDFPLGTAGPLTILTGLPDDFLVINCDILSSLDLRAMFNNHITGNSLFTVAAYKKKYKIAYGVLQSDANNRLIKLEEKPETLQINAGIYIVNKAVLEFIPLNKPFGMDELVDSMLRHDKQVSVYPFDGYWQDIGNEEEYKTAMVAFKVSQYAFMTEDNQG